MRKACEAGHNGAKRLGDHVLLYIFPAPPSRLDKQWRHRSQGVALDINKPAGLSGLQCVLPKMSTLVRSAAPHTNKARPRSLDRRCTALGRQRQMHLPILSQGMFRLFSNHSNNDSGQLQKKLEWELAPPLLLAALGCKMSMACSS